jgi:multiple antibiotic resistance protein
MRRVNAPDPLSIESEPTTWLRGEPWMLPWFEYSRFTISLFAILSPFSALPIFFILTEGSSEAEKLRVVSVATATVAIVLAGAAIVGQVILTVLDTSLAAFQVGGGVVLMMLAFAMLKAEPSSIRPRPKDAAAPAMMASIGIIPLGLPLLAGPGSISAVIIEMNRGAGLGHATMVVSCIVIVCAGNWLVLRLSESIGNRLGRTGLDIMTRFFGLIVIAIAVQFIATGLRALFPALG